ncbi:unnamed protein product [Paramecium pentaurelia]|uniref:Uncharacterized protein n=1 Tax=Paramecium pentaurelia TaxID=43138 RepID=A0A8S1VF79_9CILI|nr:unnamed protein product [Paramecium pentaurelia]
MQKSKQQLNQEINTNGKSLQKNKNSLPLYTKMCTGMNGSDFEVLAQSDLKLDLIQKAIKKQIKQYLKQYIVFFLQIIKLVILLQN